MTYSEAIQYGLATYPSRPIILASLIDVDLVIPNLKSKFNFDFLTIENLRPQTFNPYYQLILLRKKQSIEHFEMAIAKLIVILKKQYP